LEIEYKAIHQFLLEAGAINVFDSFQINILHELMEKKMSVKTNSRITNVTRKVHNTLPGKSQSFHEGREDNRQRNFSCEPGGCLGETAFQCFKGDYFQYPDQDLRKILGDLFTV
jgi:hypothetical protein